MSNQRKLSRREFLKLTGIAISAAALKACSPNIPIETVPPTAIPTLIPTHTAAPTRTPAPTPTPTAMLVEALFPDMVLVEAGGFQMGAVLEGYPNQQPIHPVNITRPFYIAKYEMTFEEYDRFCNDTLRKRAEDRWGRGEQALLGVNWVVAVEYCNWLSEKAGLSVCYSGKGKLTACDFSASGYRLPTEAEWEYAARGGQKSRGFPYAGSNDPAEVAWFAGNASDQVHVVGQKLPNELGLYDMSGNIFELCWDWYDKDYYAISPVDDPQGPPAPETNIFWELNRVRRSGSWREEADAVRITTRSFDYMTYVGDNGFRLVRNG